mmetsp:Transcript_29630/g.59845  ORF Transcript_29630/g.59845 Transcript_29630/m.59845 type:complete len:273 (-) Transcript_29630:527-1345(-)
MSERTALNAFNARDPEGVLSILVTSSTSDSATVVTSPTKTKLPSLFFEQMPPCDDPPSSLFASALGGADVLKPPNVNPPGPILLLFDDPAKLNPPAPILPLEATGLGRVVDADPLSLDVPAPAPGFSVSHAEHLTTEGPFVTMHTSHFHEPFSDVLKRDPHPSLLSLDSFFDDAASLSLLSASLSSSLSPSPNNQSTYHCTKTLFLITFFPLDESTSLIFLTVRLCSSSQYVVPIDSSSFAKSDASMVSLKSSQILSNAASAFVFSSATSLS